MCDEILVVMTNVLTRPKLQMGSNTLVEKKMDRKMATLK